VEKRHQSSPSTSASPSQTPSTPGTTLPCQQTSKIANGINNIANGNWQMRSNTKTHIKNADDTSSYHKGEKNETAADGVVVS